MPCRHRPLPRLWPYPTGLTGKGSLPKQVFKFLVQPDWPRLVLQPGSTSSKATSKSGRIGLSTGGGGGGRGAEGEDRGGRERGELRNEGACARSISEALSSTWCQEVGTTDLQRAGLSSGLLAGVPLAL